MIRSFPSLTPDKKNYMRIGPYALRNNLFLAPMAGVTDRPFRQLCRQFGAGMAVSEMVSSNSLLWGSTKTLRRADHEGESEPRSVQIAGSDPRMMAEAARFNADRGAQIIDINMGCPAKKVCKVAAGSALLQDAKLVARILEAVVGAADIPVSLKIRTGWDRAHRNGPHIARIAEQCGIQLLSVHGRTRACLYKGEAEYDTIAAISAAIKIPVIANGDIATPEKAKWVMDYTGAAGIMIGRGAQGRPWVFREVDYFLKTGHRLLEPSLEEIRDVLLGHLRNLYAFYGEHMGVRVARKHISWYTKGIAGAAAFRNAINRVEGAQQQEAMTRTFFDSRLEKKELAA